MFIDIEKPENYLCGQYVTHSIAPSSRSTPQAMRQSANGRPWGTHVADALATLTHSDL